MLGGRVQHPADERRLRRFVTSKKLSTCKHQRKRGPAPSASKIFTSRELRVDGPSKKLVICPLPAHLCLDFSCPACLRPHWRCARSLYDFKFVMVPLA